MRRHLTTLAILWLASCAQLPSDPDDTPPMNATPFLLFQDGKAEEAIRFYVDTFADGRVLQLDKYGPGGPVAEGKLQLGDFEVAGLRIRCTDSPPVHDFGFTPAVSIFIDLDSLAEIERLAAALSEGGNVMMPLDNYGFSERFTWVEDRYGISWQLNIPSPAE